MKEKLRPEMKQLNSLLNEIDAAYHNAAVKLGASDSELIILYLLAACDGVCPVSDISKSGISKQTANSALRKLEGEGNIVLEAAGGLRKNVRLTDSGMELADKTAARIIEIENSIFDSWDKREVRQYIELNRKYLEQLKEKIKNL